jgi:hypothetical protein
MCCPTEYWQDYDISGLGQGNFDAC